jgi:peptidoglycan/LPS O-acetylase OafA/YrhL
LGLIDGAGMALLLAVFWALLYWAARGHLSVLNHRILVGLGVISYTLYLVHENIGWAVIQRLEQAGMHSNIAIALALTLAVVLACLLTYVVERPAMRWIRTRYRRRMEARPGTGTALE